MSECNVSEDPEDTGSGEDDEDDFEDTGKEQSTPEKRARHAITGRGVTLSMLMADGIIHSGEELLSLEYLGQKFTADLLTSGKIKSNETEEVFGSPSSWAIYCKKLVNPAKKSGCGWASVKYKGRKLDSWKMSWFRLVKPRKPSIPDGQSPSHSDMGLSNDDGMSSNLSETDSKVPETFHRIESGVPLLEADSNMEVPRNEKDVTAITSATDMSILRPESDMSVLKPEGYTSVLRPETDVSLLRPATDVSALTSATDMSVLRPESDMSVLRNETKVSAHRPATDMSVPRPATDMSVPRPASDLSVLRPVSDLSVPRPESDMSVIKNTSSMAAETSYLQDGVLDLTTKPKKEEKPAPVETVSSTPAPDVCFMGEQEEALNLSLKTDPKSKTPPTPTPRPKPVVKQEVMEHSDFSSQSDRKLAKYSSLPERSPKVDLNMLVECEQFSSVSKIQPYTVSMSTNSLLLMDFHCHLTTSEVVGYLGGKWDPATQHLSIQQAFPCRCRLGDTQNARYVEEEIRATMRHLGMSLVGWFHSHPYCLPEPSIRDIECQMSYQLRMKGARNTYFPCVGIINSPYYGKSLRTESSIQMYMVMPPPDTTQSDYGIPMSLKYSVKQNKTISEDLLAEMKRLVEFYRGDPDWITFQHSWHPGITYLEKLKTSLNNKLPEDQAVTNSFLDFVHHVLTVKPPTSQPQ